MKKIQDMFDKEHEWVTGKMMSHIREVNDMFVAERKMCVTVTRNSMEPTSDTLCSISFVFCVFGIIIFGLFIFLMLDSHYHWTK